MPFTKVRSMPSFTPTVVICARRILPAHQSEWVEPISTNYRGYEVYELPPNTQGVTALEMLNILEGYDLKTMGFEVPIRFT